MSILKTHLQSQAGEYNFANDPNAGAIGTANLGVFLPSLSQVVAFIATPIVALAGVGASLSFGFTSSAIPPNTTAFMPANPIGAFPINVPTNNVALVLFPVDLQGPVQITMSIIGAPLTAGRIKFFIQYQEFNV